MNNVQLFNQDNGKKTMSSREIAELTDKEHKNVLRDCDILNESYEKLGLLKIEQGYYTHPNTGKQQHRELLLSRMQCFDLMTGYSVELRIRVNRRWEELELKEKQQFQIPQSYSEALRELADKAEENDRLKLESAEKDRTIENQMPAVIFKESVTASNTVILVRDLAKILNQNSIDIGEQRLYDWMVENGYLIRKQRWSNKRQAYENDYMPTQRAADLKVFFVSETTISTGDVGFVKHTVKVTGKGQVYFVNKFLMVEA
jgi:phage antirepressor YoqD-like protein